MAFFDSADCLARFRRAIRQPDTADFPTTTDAYAYLGNAQLHVMARLALFAPNAVRGPLGQMTARSARSVTGTTTSGSTTVSSSGAFLLSDLNSTISGTGIPTGATVVSVNSTSSIVISQAATASGTVALTLTPDANYPYTYTFGSDADGNLLYPVGGVQLYRVPGDVPDWPMVPGVEYLMEGAIVRAPGNAALPGGAPYFQGLVLPLTLSATASPVLLPVQARELIVLAAATEYASDVGLDPTPYQTRFDEAWDRWIGAIQAQYAESGAIAAAHPAARPPRWKYYGGYPVRGMR